MEIVLMKLSTGEEIVTTYEREGDGWFKLIAPCAMYMIDRGVRGFSNDWMCSHVDEGGKHIVWINPDHIVAESPAGENARKWYLELTE